ncbi:hypothetical protein ANO14919_002970 [Xylariales sp. No.14919]|nr:hypothetical protein ANO14919_002970 [Xylariales sp. No.14919]
MAENTVETIAKEPVANAEEKAPDTTDSLPPITKEPAATVEASMVPSVPAQSTTIDIPVAPSSDAAPKAEVAVPAAEAEEDSTKRSSEPETAAIEPEKSSDPAPASEPQPATTETAASGAESSAPAGLDEAGEPPKPVSLEEVRDEDLADKKPSELKKSAGKVVKTDASAPAENNDAATSNKRKAEATGNSAKPESSSAEAEETEPPEKKPKTNGTATNGAPRKPGRPRKDKNSTAPVGKTARKTRSQGAAD